VSARGLIVAATGSRCGKTTVTLALLTALVRRGLAVRAAKAGPDYIDTAFHAAATGQKAFNLDSWAMSPPLLDALAGEAADSVDLLLIEGVLGLFDGNAASAGRRGSTADLAARFGCPVLLVLDVSGQSQSAAAVVRGFASHDPAVRIAGIVLNRLGSERHRDLITDAIAQVGVPVLGALPRDPTLGLPERHLGLVQAVEQPAMAAYFAQLAAVAERHIDVNAVLAAATPLTIPERAHAPALPPPGQRIALACDKAFSFVYTHMLEAWRRAGAEIVPFSPLADEPPSSTCDSCWLPGGYPELHAGTLANARRFRDGIIQFACTRPVHGECGGYMVLGQALEDTTGVRHAMTGLLSHTSSFAKRKLHLGYRQARLLCDGPLGRANSTLRGHEFHYAALVDRGDDEPLAEVADGVGRPLGKSGGRRGRVTGTFVHLISPA
jgi:cobyrinic acid a,c-diamide synthase